MAKKHFDVEMLIFEKARMKLSCFQDTHSLLATTCQVNEVWCVWIGTLALTRWIWISLNTSKSFHTLHPWWRGDVHWWEITSWIIHTFRGHWRSSPGCLSFFLFTGRVEQDGLSMQKTNQKKTTLQLIDIWASAHIISCFYPVPNQLKRDNKASISAEC